jgi:hypothetical protein
LIRDLQSTGAILEEELCLFSVIGPFNGIKDC